jgi:ketosteroid isomerase-like protein
MMLELARRYSAAVASGDGDAMRELHEPDAAIWHNTDGRAQAVEENIRVSRWLRRKVPDLAFTDVRHTPTDDGFVLRHRMTGTLPGGGRLDLPSCLVVAVSGQGRIARVEEYLDGAGLNFG